MPVHSHSQSRSAPAATDDLSPDFPSLGDQAMEPRDEGSHRVDDQLPDLPQSPTLNLPHNGPDLRQHRLPPRQKLLDATENDSDRNSSLSLILAKNAVIGPSRPSVGSPLGASSRAYLDSQLKKTGPLHEQRSSLYEPEDVEVEPKSSTLTVHGIHLVPTDCLPDVYRPIFPFAHFNAVQSKCFDLVYQTNDNMVVVAPTGTGKKAIIELAICALARDEKKRKYKVVYQAPTKSLCSERKKDWEEKLSHLGLAVTELRGDMDQAQIKTALDSDVIITTPEKWDAVTRRCDGHRKLLDMVRLFLVDEVHCLKETSGATLEVVVSRMKSIGCHVRFIALGATIPNSEDICAWLGRNSESLDKPAHLETFGPEFRPVGLLRLIYAVDYPGNPLLFDEILNEELAGYVRTYSYMKPAVIICSNVAICVSTAKLLAQNWKEWRSEQRPWTAPGKEFSFTDNDLQSVAECGVAFYHAGVSPAETAQVESMFLDGDLGVICCTPMSAVGINLQVNLVIIKSTTNYWTDSGAKEYMDLEISQMIGRAGHLQSGNTGVAIIMTTRARAQHYNNMFLGEEARESRLGLNIEEHMNAEIGLGKITDKKTAKQWLRSTFFKKIPRSYKLNGETQVANLEQRLDEVYEKGIASLVNQEMIVNNNGKLTHTKFGEAMFGYYTKMGTMHSILNLPPKSLVQDVLNALSEAEEFKELRMRSGEIELYEELNRSGIRFPLKGQISTPAHKVSILIQFSLARLEFPWDRVFHWNVMEDKLKVIKHSKNILLCLIDCQKERKDAITVLSAQELYRSLHREVWENTALELYQLQGISVGTAQAFWESGVRSLQKLATLEPYQIESIIDRKPPCGTEILGLVRKIPILKVSARLLKMLKTSNRDRPVFAVEAQMELQNLDAVLGEHSASGYVFQFLAARSDGYLVFSERLGIQSLPGGVRTTRFTIQLEGPDQFLRCHAACFLFAGTCTSSTLKFNVDTLFPAANPKPMEEKESIPSTADATLHSNDEYGGADIFDDINIDSDNYSNERRATSTPAADDPHLRQQTFNDEIEAPQDIQFPTIKWDCRHKCKDKTTCKHTCCREGLDKPPKIPKMKTAPAQNEPQLAEVAPQPRQAKPEILYSSKPKGGLKASGGPHLGAPPQEKTAQDKARVADPTDGEPMDDGHDLMELHHRRGEDVVPMGAPAVSYPGRSSSFASSTSTNKRQLVRDGTDLGGAPPPDHIAEKNFTRSSKYFRAKKASVGGFRRALGEISEEEQSGFNSEGNDPMGVRRERNEEPRATVKDDAEFVPAAKRIRLAKPCDLVDAEHEVERQAERDVE